MQAWREAPCHCVRLKLLKMLDTGSVYFMFYHYVIRHMFFFLPGMLVQADSKEAHPSYCRSIKTSLQLRSATLIKFSPRRIKLSVGGRDYHMRCVQMEENNSS